MRGSGTVTIEAECDLSQFDELDVVAYAAEIIRCHRLAVEPDRGARGRKSWEDLQDAVQEVATACGIELPEDRLLPPRSTAASIQSLEQLRALLAARSESVKE